MTHLKQRKDNRNSTGSQYVRTSSFLAYSVFTTWIWSNGIGLFRCETVSLRPVKIPSDTVCYPAKLSHGHIERLKKMKCDHIFWPCLSYNLDEGKSVNHYNCPIVAYYAESAQSTNSGPEILRPYFGIHRPKDFKKRFTKWIRDEIDPTLSAIQIHRTIDYAYQAYYDYMDDVARMADSWLEEARKKKQKIIILCGRPYHIDPEVIHGIDQYLTSLGCLVLSEDSIAHHTKKGGYRCVKSMDLSCKTLCSG